MQVQEGSEETEKPFTQRIPCRIKTMRGTENRSIYNEMTAPDAATSSGL
ncbi:hypothetical protein PROFUN_04443 [Planoprotostelium fungivorum]|uniref:Uncharacterized protein n=1 Tax=Planoprotostelium fungivorum TaxID=1890364 RepID=A0A2P6NVM3_9EUKA|nr:hypothetical protein PROFUN_04443 [Planoprotostelium fungivorum]